MRDNILAVAEQLGVPRKFVRSYGPLMAKIDPAWLDERKAAKPGRLVLVAGMTPTPAGEGKTTTSIGLADGLNHMGQKAALSLREPSLGPCLGRKGGGTGFGRARLVPDVDINLHFTGDFHAISSAHNYLAAMIDNHLHFELDPKLDTGKVLWRRAMDMNDRALRTLELGRGKGNGPVRESGFDITAASEVMAILALSYDASDLRARLSRIVIGEDASGRAITAKDVGAVGGMMALLKDAVHPNLVQTLEGTPAFVHAGPFANIAHGTSSILATRMALGAADWVVTEGGFGFDLGGEKYFNLVCPVAGFAPALVVLVATIKALKMHGGKALADLGTRDLVAIEQGLVNLERHIESIRQFDRPVVVALNRFANDEDQEIDVVRKWATKNEIAFAVSTHGLKGAVGAKELAQVVAVTALRSPSPVKALYQERDPLPEKIRQVARAVYGARDVILTQEAQEDLKRFARLGFGDLPVCVAKTQNSLSDDPTKLGRPTDFTITVRRLELSAGAGFLVALTGDILRMPGLPRVPRGLAVDLVDGKIIGVG